MKLKRTKQDRSRQGSVLMETVIALPIYLVLLGGIMWEGQLIYDKQQMVIADRYAAWNLGNRWRTPEWAGDPDTAGLKLSLEIQGFFPDMTMDEVSLFVPAVSPVSGWVWRSSAGIEVTANMPSWTMGPIYAGVIAYGAAAPPASGLIAGRDIASQSGDYIGHVVLMRTDNPDPRTSPVGVNDGGVGELNLSSSYHN